jgi:hypothetical protein
MNAPVAIPSSAKSAASTHPAAWESFVELFPPGEADALRLPLIRLIETLQAIDRGSLSAREAAHGYAAWMKLFSMLPIYLRADTSSPARAVSEANILASQSRLLIDLDEILGCELFELLIDPSLVEIPPAQAVQIALNTSLTELVSRLGPMSGQIASPLPLAENWPCDASCEGYWSIARQWIDGRPHLRIPASLSLGKVVWPKVREHWSKMSHALSKTKHPTAEPITIREIVEIRNSSDPQLSETLDIHLERCREEHRSMAFAVMKVHKHFEFPSSPTELARLPDWQERMIEHLNAASDGRITRGFVNDSAELTLIIDDLDRSEITYILREALEIASQPDDSDIPMIERPRVPIVAGVAWVSSPSKRFQIEQLTQSAWRCLEAAQLQGAGTVKSLEVY